MFSEEFKEVIRNTSIAGAGLLSGGIIALILMQYQGSLEIRFSAEEGFIKMDSRPQCELILQEY